MNTIAFKNFGDLLSLIGILFKILQLELPVSNPKKLF